MLGLLLDLHIFCICTTLAIVAVADLQGLLWVLGYKRTLAAPLLKWLHSLVALGLACIITTGTLLVLSGYGIVLDEPVFYIKMAFVLALIVNAFFVHSLHDVAARRAWSELSRAERIPLIVSGAVSTLSWIGAATCGLLL